MTLSDFQSSIALHASLLTFSRSFLAFSSCIMCSWNRLTAGVGDFSPTPSVCDSCVFEYGGGVDCRLVGGIGDGEAQIVYGVVVA